MKLAVYVPDLNRSSFIRSTVARGSAIVAAPDSKQKDPENILVYYEGNIIEAANMSTFEDKLVSAADRAVNDYPTSAMLTAPINDLIKVGEYEPTTKRFFADKSKVSLMDAWSKLERENGSFAEEIKQQYPDIIWDESADKKLLEVETYWAKLPEIAQTEFHERLYGLNNYGVHEGQRSFRVKLSFDSAICSFAITWYKEGTKDVAFYGGLIFHGSNQDPFCVSLTPCWWGIHT